MNEVITDEKVKKIFGSLEELVGLNLVKRAMKELFATVESRWLRRGLQKSVFVFLVFVLASGWGD